MFPVVQESSFLRSLMLLKKKPFIHAGLSLFFCFSILIFFASQANAQSGRRLPKLSPKPTETTTPKEPPVEESKPAKPQEKAPLVSVMVVYQLYNVMSSQYLTNAVLDGCLERLQKAIGLTARFGKEMNRKEASDIAQKSSDTYVLWLQLESESFGQDTGRNSAQSYYVNYVLYTPGTAKSKSSGHVYQRQRGVNPLPQGDISAEYALKRAGRELADRVLGALNLPLPPDRY
jgi:hypothetical protein